MEIAEHKREQATDYFEFTHLICIAFSHEQKIQLIEALWKIAFVDNKFEVEEEYLVDKVARLLFIPHIEVLQARNRVRETWAHIIHRGYSLRRRVRFGVTNLGLSLRLSIKSQVRSFPSPSLGMRSWKP